VAAGFDVASRLAEGRPAVEDMQTYVWASRLRGYQNSDLTSHGAQVRDWYGSDDGLDLQALDADCASLGAAAAAADEAARSARQQVGALSGAWTGAGGDAAADFLRRHCDSAAALAEEVRAAAEACAGLRDELWRIVDRKVEATAAVARGADTHRATWLAACGSVLSGGLTGEDAADIVEGQVKLFVHNVIRGEWVPSMHSATDAADVAYRTALDAVGPGDLRFDVPGELVPSPAAPTAGSSPVAPPPAGPSVVPSPSRLSAPVAQPWTSGDPPSPEPGPRPPADGWARAEPMPSDAWPAPGTPSPLDALASQASQAFPASWPAAGAGPGLAGSGLPDTGFGSAMPLGRALGGLLGGAPWPDVTDPLPTDSLADAFDIPELDELEPGGAEADDDDPDSGEDVEDGEDVADADGMNGIGGLPAPYGPDDGQLAVEPHVAADGVQPAPVDGVRMPPADDAEAAAQPAVSPPPGGETPCEIAADELPQAGR
jgi:hypothetical protein